MSAIDTPATSHPAVLEREAVREAIPGDPAKTRTFALLSVSASLERVAYALAQQNTSKPDRASRFLFRACRQGNFFLRC